MATNPRRREDLVTLIDYVKGRSNGEVVSWVEIEQTTSIDMNQDYGRPLLREACRKTARKYLSLPGRGVEFSSAENANEIAQKAVGAVVKTVVRASHTVATLSDQHLDQMTSEQSRILTGKQAFLATLNVSTSLARRLPSK